MLKTNNHKHKRDVKIGLTLGGGGARGLCQIEFLKVLDELDITPCMISGCSIGAIIGAFYAAGFSAIQIEEIINEIGLHELTRFIDFTFLKFSSLVKGKGVERFLEKKLPVRMFEQLDIPLKIVATDFWREKMVIFDSGDLIPAIRASISIPGVFEPVVIDDMVLIDGGIFNNLPYGIINDHCDFLIAIDVSGTQSIPSEPKIPNMLDNITGTIRIMQNSVVTHQMKSNEPDIYVRPELRDFHLLEFDNSKKIMKSVKKDVEKFRKELIEKLYSEKHQKSLFKNLFS